MCNDLSTIQSSIASGLKFLDGLQSDHPGQYWEVLDPQHGEHKIYPQSQYLLYITLKRFGKFELARPIHDANNFKSLTVDRRNTIADARFCVLDNDAPPFCLADWGSSQLPDNFDEVGLLGHYWSLTGNSAGATQCATFLWSQWNSQFQVLGMDSGDRSVNPPFFRVYKTALAGTLFARVGGTMLAHCQSTAVRLQSLQDTSGGWKTDLDANGVLQGVPNIETTCLTLICMDSAAKGGFS